MKMMEVINNVIGMAIREGSMNIDRALAMTEDEKVRWFDELLESNRKDYEKAY
jgi:hypothetical protein